MQAFTINGDNDGSPINPSVAYSYDALDRLVGVSRGGATTSLTYDYAGRKLSMNDPDMGAWLYSYNPVGTLSYQKDARNQYICLYFDPINRLQGKHYRQDASCPSEPDPYNVRYLYDDYNPQNGQYGIGLRTGMQDDSGSASWSFDTRSRTWKESRSINNIGTFATQWSYNQADLLISMVYPGGDNGSLGEQIDYTYHPQLTINTISGLPQYLHHDILQSTTYDATNRTVQRVLGENTLRTSFAYHPWNTTDYGDLLQQILTQTTGGTPTTYHDLRYTLYDRSGNIRTIQDYVTGAPQIQSFDYDNLDQLISGGASGGSQGNFGPESYNYDATSGNLSNKAGVSYTYGDQNHKHAVTALSNGNTYTYDANDNMTYRHVYEGGTWKDYTLIYDAENRLATVTGPVTANFKYDGDGQRIRATINGGLDTVFIGNYFEWNVATQTKRTYYYAGATRIAMREGSTDPQWILGDHLGSTSKMVSYLGADTGGQWYKAWGETRLQTGSIPTKYQYTGQYNQVIIGLYYYGARWYDTNLSRWTQPDSIIPEATQGVQAWDRYAYVNNNPVKFFDPSSHGVDCGLTDPNCKGGVPTDSLPNTEISIDSDSAHLEPVCKVLNQLTGETTFKYPANGPIPSDSYENDPNGNPIKCVSKDCVVPLLVMGLEALLVNFAPPQEYSVVASVQYEVDGVDVVYYLVTIDNSSKTNIGMVALNVETMVTTDPVLVTTTNSFNIFGEVPAGQFGGSGIFNAQLSATSVEYVKFVGFTIFDNITIIFEIPLY